MKLTKKAFREYLNRTCENGSNHKHGNYHQLKRKYGDYLYYQDREKFNFEYIEWVNEYKKKSHMEKILDEFKAAGARFDMPLTLPEEGK